MNSFYLNILEADGVFYEGKCESLVIPTTAGQYGIQANHINMIGAVLPGKLTYKIPENDEIFIASVSSGIVKVEDNEVLVLVNTAERPEEIDENKARLLADEAKERLLQQKSMSEYRAATLTLARALGRLKVKNEADK